MGILKKCKGLHKLTYGLGCGELVEKRKYGIGFSCGCFQKFVKSDKGTEYVDKFIIPKYKEKDNDFNYEKETKKRSNQNYRSNTLQPLINTIIHLIDKDQPCIVEGKRYKTNNAGHFYGVKCNETLAINFHNIFLQNEHSNKTLGGQPIEYLQGLQNTFGHNYGNFVIKLSQHKPLHLTIDELKSVAKKCRQIINELKEIDKVYTTEQRILLRNKYNLLLGVYDINHSYFNI